MITVAVGLCQLIFITVGDIIGKKISSMSKIDSRVFVIISGLLLIFMAFLRAVL